MAAAGEGGEGVFGEAAGGGVVEEEVGGGEEVSEEEEEGEEEGDWHGCGECVVLCVVCCTGDAG